MFLNYRDKPFELYYYEALAVRKELNEKEKFHFANSKKGFAGECLYDEIFNIIGHENVYVLRDIYLKVNHSVSQYDSIIVTGNRVVVNEVKNLTGEYRYESNGWYKNKSQVENDPFVQLSRAKSKLISLQKNSALNFRIDGDVIFPNDDFDFTSDSIDMSKQTVLRHQMKKYFRRFKNESLGYKSKNIVQLIKNSMIDKPVFPEHLDISELKRGLYCGECYNFDLIKGKFQFKCSMCESIESYEIHLVRAMFDYKYLFPNQKMTRKALLHLIDYGINQNTVYYALKKHCNVYKNGNNTSYSLKYNNLHEQIMKIRNTQRYKDKISTTKI